VDEKSQENRYGGHQAGNKAAARGIVPLEEKCRGKEEEDRPGDTDGGGEYQRIVHLPASFSLSSLMMA
jgi:hypothetical protein